MARREHPDHTLSQANLVLVLLSAGDLDRAEREYARLSESVGRDLPDLRGVLLLARGRVKALRRDEAPSAMIELQVVGTRASAFATGL